jgi:hypothetical protein
MSADLAARKQQLRQRSAQLRDQIAVRAQVLRPGLRAIDHVRDGVQSVRRLQRHHALPLLLGAALLGMTLTRPRATFKLGLRVWSGWQVLRHVQPLIVGLLGRR